MSRKQEGRAPAFWQNIPAEMPIRLAGQDGRGRWGEGHDPFNPSAPDSTPHRTWQKHTFKMRNQDPSLKGSVLFQLDQFPYLVGKHWGFYEKKKKKETSNYFKKINKEA